MYCLDSASFVVCSDLGPTHYVLLEKGKKQHVRPIGTANKVSSVYTHFFYKHMRFFTRGSIKHMNVLNFS